MQHEASIKISSKLECLNRELKSLYNDFFNDNGIIDSDTVATMIVSTEREIEIYNYINNLIDEKKSKHTEAYR
jgi:hypothetical protein